MVGHAKGVAWEEPVNLYGSFLLAQADMEEYYAKRVKMQNASK
jgi:hypothetical protein